MSKRITVVVVAAAVVFAGGVAGNMAHAGSTRIHWSVAGTIVSVQLATRTGDSMPALLIDAFLVGAPGKAQFRVVAGAEDPSPSIPGCGDGPGQYFAFDDMIITFEDQSMLFAKMNPDLRGWHCFGPYPAVANMVVIGGTGRYEDVRGGQFVGIFDGTTVGDSNTLIAETGTIEGWIDR